MDNRSVKVAILIPSCEKSRANKRSYRTTKLEHLLEQNTGHEHMAHRGGRRWESFALWLLMLMMMCREMMYFATVMADDDNGDDVDAFPLNQTQRGYV